MNWYKKSQENHDQSYPPIKGDEVDGRNITKNIPNMSSIGSSLTNYRVLPGIREVKMNLFYLTGTSYSPQEDKRIKDLAEKIDSNKWIDPLIVVVEKEGPYILEGAHRAEALFLLKAESFPAIVVISEES